MGRHAQKGDVLSPSQRTLCMSRNKGRDTAPELKLRKLCWSMGLRYRLRSRITGKPDFVFLREKVAVFVDGCFWHGCPEHYVAPATRPDFWSAKLAANRARDEAVNGALLAAGWTVFRVWEHDLRTADMRLGKATQLYDLVCAKRLVSGSVC